MIRPVFTEIALFLAPFVIYAIYLITTKSALLTLASWPPKVLATLGICALILMIGSFVYLSHFSGSPAGLDLRTGPCRRTRQFRSGTGAVSEPPLRSLKEAAWLREGPLARLLQVLDRDGEEARVVGGAVRNALLGEPIHEFDIATTAVPDEVIGGRPRRASSRCRPASSTAPSPW